MTSVIAPWAAATQLATAAQTSLTTASSVLVDGGPTPPTWFSDPLSTSQFSHAASLASDAIAHLDSALSFGTSLSKGVNTAFTNARNEAVAGVGQLTSPTLRPINPEDVALQFNGAVVWLDLAKNLIALENPVTIQLHDPTNPMPHDPENPVTIQ